MKKAIMVIAMLIVSLTLSAQTPKAVIKSVMYRDLVKAREKFNAISDKIWTEMPEMCALAEAMILTHDYNIKKERIDGYRIFCKFYNDIRNSEHLDKVMNGCKTSYEDIKRAIEERSMEYVLMADQTEIYRTYINLARTRDHHALEILLQRLEIREYIDVCNADNEMQYRQFMNNYPESAHREDINTRLAALLYNDIMHSDDERRVEMFTIEFPTFKNIASAKQHLMELRYKRITTSSNLSELEWFAATYPDHENIEHITQLMADVVYPTVDDSPTQLLTFIESYPKSTQRADAERRLKAFDIVERGDIESMIDYILKYGYDNNYQSFLRAIAEKQGLLIITKDIREVSLIRVRNKEGKVGYIDFDANMVIKPLYSLDECAIFPAISDMNNLAYEFRDGRDVAIAGIDGKWGVLKNDGTFLINPQYLSICFLNKSIACATKIDSNNKSSNEEEDISVCYTCTMFDYNGNMLQKNREFWNDSTNPWHAEYDLDWFSINVIGDSTDQYYYKLSKSDGELITANFNIFSHCTPDYMSSPENEFLKRDGTKLKLDIKRSTTYNHVTDNIIFYTDPDENTVLYDLDSQSIIIRNKYQQMQTVSDDLIAAQLYDGCWEYLDNEFNTVLRGYNNATPFICGVAAVLDDNGWHIIDHNGRRASDYFEKMWALPDNPGLFCVGNDKKFGIIDSKGNIVVPLDHSATKSLHYDNTLNLGNGVIYWLNDESSLLYFK